MRFKNERPYDLSSSPKNIRMIKFRRRAGPVARIGEKGKVCIRFWWGIMRETDHLEDLGVDKRIISESNET